MSAHKDVGAHERDGVHADIRVVQIKFSQGVS